MVSLGHTQNNLDPRVALTCRFYELSNGFVVFGAVLALSSRRNAYHCSRRACRVQNVKREQLCVLTPLDLSEKVATEGPPHPKTTRTSEFENNKHLYGPIKMFIISKLHRLCHFCLFRDSGRPGKRIIKEFTHAGTRTLKTTKNDTNE